MKILLLFGTSQGQTQKIMHHLAKRLDSKGHDVALTEAVTDPAPDIASFGACILAASVHAGRFQDALVDVARQQAQALSARPGLFLSVSLTAAGNEPEERAELDRLAETFLDETGWQGARVEHVAGALRFSEYGFFEYWAMRWIARHKKRKVDAFKNLDVTGKQDVEFTDWNALDTVVDDWLTSAVHTRGA